MITKNNLPVGYRPYEQLTFCSNLLIGGGHIIQIGDVLPLLIGQGDRPQVWLQVPSDSTGAKFVEVVSASIPEHPAFTVIGDEFLLSVSFAGKPLLQVRSIGPGQAEVDYLDLRPVGFNIYGDKNALHVGGMQMSRNTFSGGGTLLALGSA